MSDDRLLQPNPGTAWIPEREPFLSEWCRLHALHEEALRQAQPGAENERVALRACNALSVAKCRVYLASVGGPVTQRRVAK